MNRMKCEKMDLKGLYLIHPFYSEDERGYFLKSYEKDIYLSFGIKTDVYEDFESYSKKGVIRGLHFQYKYPQAKLIRAITGKIFDVVVDLRSNLTTFGEWRGVILSQENKDMLYIPEGFAHGFLVLSDYALISYKCKGKYYSELDSGILWNDELLNIKWPLEEIDNVIISEKDKNLQTFQVFKESIKIN